MTAKKIPLFDVTLSDAALRQTMETLKSGWLTTGPKAAAFEKAVADYCSVKHAAALNSATAGLVLGLRALEIGKGDEVITTPYTFVATIEAILHCGATPVLCDIDPTTLTIDPKQAERKFTKRTKVILAVDLAGHPCDYYQLNKIALAHKTPILSDSAHAFGAAYRGKAIPHYTDLSVFSFHSTKNLTCGEGGMVVSKEKTRIESVRLLAKHAMTRNAFQRRTEGGWEYDVVGLGYKGNISDVHASIGLGELEHFEANQAKRAQTARRYTENLRAVSDFVETPRVEEGYHHAWHLYLVRLRTDRLRISRNQFIEKLADKGIECGVHYKPVFEMSYYRQFGWDGKQFPQASACGARVVSLPLFPRLSLSQVDYICDVIVGVITKAARKRAVR